MADARLACCHCRLPIRPGSTGLRHYGLYTAHSENECTRLLHAEIDRLTAEAEGTREAFGAVVEQKEAAEGRVASLQKSLDIALQQRDAAKRDAERALSMYRALRERMQAAMQETIEEQPR